MSQAKLRGLKAAKGAKKGPMVPRECAGASAATRGEAPSRDENYTNVYNWQPNSHIPALHKGYKEKGRWESPCKANLPQEISPFCTPFHKGMDCLDEERFSSTQCRWATRKEKKMHLSGKNCKLNTFKEVIVNHREHQNSSSDFISYFIFQN